MFSKPKEIAKSLFSDTQDLTSIDVAAARKYIADYWPKLIRYHPKDDESLFGLPYPYIVPAYSPSHEFDYNEMYYWDSYFVVQGLLDNEHKELVIGILDNLISLFKHFKIIPNASRTYLTGRSQPPFLTTFIFNLYDRYDLGLEWLKPRIAVAEEEYHTVWTGTVKPNARLIYQGLSRYYDINYLHDLAEAESGWDLTPRFNRKCLNYLPIDLNSLLFRYEMDFVRFYELTGEKETASQWAKAADHRKNIIDELMWSDLRGMYYDYNFVKEKRGVVNSLATFYPMWAGMIDQVQADQLVHSIKRFEQRGGLSTTDAQQFNQLVPGAIPTQWAYPNGWAPLHFIVIEGLKRYGYDKIAKDIAQKWIRTNLAWFNEHGEFLEKYNVVSPSKPPLKGVYPSQTGFGWTNSIFERLCKEFIDPK